MAIKPALRRLANSSSAVFLIKPPFVAMTRYLPSLWRGSGIIAVTFSPPVSWSRLTMAVPRAVRPASGISYPFMLYTRPRLVKNMISSCVEVTSICSA